MIYIDDFKYFNKQIKYYTSLLEYFSNNSHKYYENTLCSLINTIDLMTLYISKFEQESSNTEQINEIFNELESVKDIEILEQCDSKKQIRNCLSHADFRICIDDNLATPTLMDNGIYAPEFSENGLYLELNNGKIKGRLSFRDFAKIALKYNEISVNEKILPRLVLIPNKTNFKSSENLNSFLDEIEYLKVTFFKNEHLKKEDTEKIFEYLMTFLQSKLLISSESDLNNYRNFLNMRLKLYGENDYNISRCKISKEDKEFIKSYIKYIGIGVWNNDLKDSEKVLVLKDIFEMQNGKYCNLSNTNWAQMVLSNIPGVSKERGKYLSYEKPFMYADTLLSYSNYCFNYIREVNHKKKNSDDRNFKFKNIDLNGINPFFSDSKEKKEREVIISDEVLIKELEFKKENLYNAIWNIIRKINNMNSNNRDPKKESNLLEIDTNLENINVYEIIHRISNKIMETGDRGDLTPNLIEKTIKELMQGYDCMTEQERSIFSLFKETVDKYRNKKNNEYPIVELDDELFEIEKKIIDSQNRYMDSSNFFRHMRNSLAHGKYSVDYSKALKTKDLGDIRITFEDCEEDEKSTEDKEKKEKIIFSVTIKAKRLLKLLSDYCKITNNQLEEECNSKDIEQLQYDVHQYGLNQESLITDMPQGMALEEKIELVNENIKALSGKRGMKKRPTNEDFENEVGAEALIDAIEGRNFGIEILEDGIGEKDDQ